MSIQYTVPGFELTTLEHESPPITPSPGLTPHCQSYYVRLIIVKMVYSLKLAFLTDFTMNLLCLYLANR